MPFSAGILTGNTPAAPVYPVYGTETNDLSAASYNAHLAEVRKVWDYILAGDKRVAYLRKRYGAGGQGATDDTQALIDAVANDGANSIIVVEPGTYYLSSKVTIPAHKTIVAQCPVRHPTGGRKAANDPSTLEREKDGTTVFVTDQDITMLEILGGAGLFGLMLTGEALTDGTLVTVGAPSGDNDDGFLCNCWIRMARKGLVATNMQGWLVQGNTFDYFGGNCVELSACHNNQLLGNRFFHPVAGCGAILGGASWFNQFVGNVFDHASSYAWNDAVGTVGPLRAGLLVQEAYHTLVEANNFNQNYIHVTVDNSGGGEHTVIGPNSLAASFAESIYLNQAQKVTIAPQQWSNRHKWNEGGAGYVTTAHVKVAGACSRVWIGGGVMSGDGKKNKGVELSATTTKSYVGPLICDDIATPVSDLNGTNTVVAAIV